MANDLSARLAAVLNALPLRDGLRVLEVGCGPGALARAIAARIGDGHVLAIDRSVKAIDQARSASQIEIASGRLAFRHVAIENFELQPHEALYDVAVAIRVGALDGRHPTLENRSLRRIAEALTPRGQLYIDGGDPLRTVRLRD